MKNTGLMEILDQGRAVQSTIQGAPVKGLFGELYKNSVEGGATELHATVTAVDGFPVRKAMFIDNGRGIDAATLMNLKGIFGKPKASNGKKETNYNTGARAMTIESNNLGVVFVSKHSGVIRAIRLYKDSEGYKYAYEEDAYLNDYGEMFGFDQAWTAVILLGNDKTQDTYEKPYANSPSYPFRQQYIDREYIGRLDFFTLNMEEIESTEAVHNRGTVWNVRPRGAKFQIRYILGERPMMGVLHESELFDIQKFADKNFFHGNGTFLYGALGAYAVASELSVIIVLDDETDVAQHKKLICQTQYRDALVNCRTRETIDFNHFMKYVESRMPDALLQYIAEKEEKEGEIKLKNRTADLSKEFMRKLGMNMEMLKPDAKSDKTMIVSGGTNPNPSPTPRPTPKPKPEPNPNGIEQAHKGEVKNAKTTKGLTRLVAAWEEKEWEKQDVGYVTGKTKAYFNKSNAIFKYAVEDVRKAKGMQKQSESAIKEALRNMLAESYGLALAWELDEAQSAGVILNNAMMLLGTGEFKKQYIASIKNKGE